MAKQAKKEEKPVGKVVKFEAEIDGKKVACEIGDPDIPKFHVPGFGVMTSEEAVKNQEVLAWLIENGSSIVRTSDGSEFPSAKPKEEKPESNDLKPLIDKINALESVVVSIGEKLTVSELAPKVSEEKSDDTGGKDSKKGGE